MPNGAIPAASDAPLAIQAGTVAGTIPVSLRLERRASTSHPRPRRCRRHRVERAAPALTCARTSAATAMSLRSKLSGFRRPGNCHGHLHVYRSSGKSLQSSQVLVTGESVLGAWSRDMSSTGYGGAFTFTQPFTMQGDGVDAVIPAAVTLTNSGIDQRRISRRKCSYTDGTAGGDDSRSARHYCDRGVCGFSVCAR